MSNCSVGGSSSETWSHHIDVNNNKTKDGKKERNARKEGSKKLTG
jgi:hypothetical protein